MDAARLLPFVGVFVFFVPMLFGPEAGTLTATVFVFLAWIALILTGFAISRSLARNVDTAPDEAEEG